MRKFPSLILAAASIWMIAPGCTCQTDPAASAPPATDKKLIAAKVTVKPDQVAAFIAVTPSILTASRAEPGCVHYTMYQNPHQPTDFFFFEEWKNQAAIDFHFATPHFKAFGDQIKDMVAAPPEILIFDARLVPPANPSTKGKP